MSSVAVMKVESSGGPGGPGVSRFHFARVDTADVTVADCNSAGAKVQTMYGAMSSLQPDDIVYHVNPSVELLDISTGALHSVVTMSVPPADVASISTVTWTAGGGASIYWHTGRILRRRLIRGRTFIVPLISSAFGTDGLVTPSVVTTITNAATTYLSTLLAAAIDPIVYARPSTPGGVDGDIGIINSGSVSRTPATLRSRKT